MLKLAIVSKVADGTLRESIEFALKHGFKAVELHGKYHDADRLSDEDVEYMLGIADANGITFNTHFHHDALPASHRKSMYTETLAKFARDIQLVSRLGGNRIVLHPGKIDVPTLKSPEDASELIRREALRNLTRFITQSALVAENAGVVICVENMHHKPGDVVQSYQELANVIDNVQSDNVAVVLDVGHCIIGDGLTQAIQLFGNRIKHLHLDDAVDGIEHQEIGIGILDFEEMAPLMSDDFDIQFATLEVGSKEPDGGDVILRSRDALRAHYPETIA